MKGQALAYNKDNQEDKEPLFDAADTLPRYARRFAELIAGIQVKRGRDAGCGQGRLRTATALPLPGKKGLRFRDAR